MFKRLVIMFSLTVLLCLPMALSGCGKGKNPKGDMMPGDPDAAPMTEEQRQEMMNPESGDADAE